MLTLLMLHRSHHVWVHRWVVRAIWWRCHPLWRSVAARRWREPCVRRQVEEVRRGLHHHRRRHHAHLSLNLRGEERGAAGGRAQRGRLHRGGHPGGLSLAQGGGGRGVRDAGRRLRFGLGGLAPQQLTPNALHHQLVAQRRRRLFRSLARGVGHEGARARRDDAHRRDFPVPVKRVPEVRLPDLGVQAPDEQRHDALVLGRGEKSHVISLGHELGRHRVVHSVVAVLQVLLRQRPGVRHLVPVRALRAARALALGEEGAQVRAVALVVRGGALQLQQKLRLLGLAVVPAWAVEVNALRLRFVHELRLVLSVDVRLGQLRALLPHGFVAHLHRQAVLQVQQTHLAHVLCLGARLAYLRLLVPGV
mmetsp:Transcript_45066/g.86181  ORF Transcript_45066/g.86181 Transcript_45066/m.86181 type:complete len:363 (+) Transcript_45066:587-1675(+)